MPAELFRSASSYTPVRRRASILPVSIAAHVALIAAIFTAPLFGDIDFPPPNRPLNFAYTQVTLPPAPPVTLRPPPSRQTPTTSPAKAPLDAPAIIKPESAIELTQSFGPDRAGDDVGVPFGITDSIGPPVAPLPPPPVVDRKPMKVGGLIQAPRRIVSVAPVYPAIAQQARVDGEVTIEALIGEDGKVRNAKVIQGKQMLSEAALTAVRQWVFTPTRLNGEPVAVIMTVTVVFSLQ
jgi:periplasmic protein TonB